MGGDAYNIKIEAFKSESRKVSPIEAI